MRQPNHIILDFNNNVKNNSSQYWAVNFLNNELKYPQFLNDLDIQKKFNLHNELSNNSKFLNSKYTLNFVNDTNKSNIERMFYLYNSNTHVFNNNTLNNTWHNIININFLRKERLYTKLKYSRSPAYDIVSGGSAALLAGLLGFLVSEKFGMELVDSGDFYYLFMYFVFLAFSIRPLLIVAESNKSFFNTFSINRLLLFYNQIILLFFRFIKNLFKF